MTLDPLEEFRHLWVRGKESDWVLVGEMPSFLIRNRVTRAVFLIEDDELLELITHEMAEAGVPIIERLDL